MADLGSRLSNKAVATIKLPPVLPALSADKRRTRAVRENWKSVF